MRNMRQKCQAGAVNFDDQDKLVVEEVGAIIAATGYQLYDIGKEQSGNRLAGYGEYGYGSHPDVIDSLQFERLISASGLQAAKFDGRRTGKRPRRSFLLAV